MPTAPTRDDDFIRLFLSAYEDGSWADATFSKPDNIERIKPAVDQLATRRSDGKTLAIEHTVIEPFVSDKEDFAFFEATLLSIEKDASLLVPGRWIRVFVPVGTLRNQHKKVAQNAIVQSVHGWIRSNRLTLRDGASQHSCAITGIPGKPSFDITLNLKVVPLEVGPAAELGSLWVRRQQVKSNLGEVIEKALRKKLPKLTHTVADKRILLLERQHMNLYPQDMLDEIEKRRALFPKLAGIHEIWIMETIFYGTPLGGTYLRFELYENGNEVSSFDFNDGRLVTKFEHGVSEIIREDA